MKKVMIALLALAVVFGFVACDNSNKGPETPAYENPVVELIVTGTPELLANEKPAASDYEVKVRYFDGTIDVAPADSLKFTLEGASKASTDADDDDALDPVKVGTVEYVAYNYGYEKLTSEELKGIVYAIKALDVKGPEGTYATLYQNATKTGNVLTGTKTAATVDNLIDKEAFTVSAVYTTLDGENHTRELADDEYVVSFAASNNDETLKNVTVEFKPCLAKAGTADTSWTQSSDAGYKNYKNTATVSIIQDKISGWTAKAADGVTIVQGQATNTVQNFIEATADYESGVSATITVGGDWTSGVTSDKFNADATSATYTAEYNDEKKEISFTVVAPRATEFTVTLADTVNLTPDNAEAIELTVADVKITVSEWLNNVTPSDSATVFASGENYTVNGVSGAEEVFLTIPAKTKDGTSFGPYNVILTKYGEGAPIGTLYFTVASSKD